MSHLAMMILILNGPNMIQVLPNQPLYGSLRCGEERQLRPLPKFCRFFLTVL